MSKKPFKFVDSMTPSRRGETYRADRRNRLYERGKYDKGKEKGDKTA